MCQPREKETGSFSRGWGCSKLLASCSLEPFTGVTFYARPPPSSRSYASSCLLAFACWILGRWRGEGSEGSGGVSLAVQGLSKHRSCCCPTRIAHLILGNPSNLVVSSYHGQSCTLGDGLLGSSFVVTR